MRGPREKREPSSEFLSRFDVARKLGVGPAKVIDLEKHGLLTPYRFSSRIVRYLASDVAALIEKAKGA